MEDAFDYASYTITMLQVAKMAYDTGRMDVVERLGCFSFDCDDEYGFALEGMDALCDFMRDSGEENGEIQTMYFSSKNMMEYYRLCREHSRLTGIPLKNNSFIKRAEEHVREQMEAQDCYYCNYFLQTKINHKWASGIVFQYDCSYFSEYLALFSRLLYVFEFYDCEVAALRFDVWKLKYQPRNNVLMLPLPHEEQRRAA